MRADPFPLWTFAIANIICTNFIPYDLSVDELFLRTFGIRTLSIRSFVWTPLRSVGYRLWRQQRKRSYGQQRPRHAGTARPSHVCLPCELSAAGPDPSPRPWPPVPRPQLSELQKVQLQKYLPLTQCRIPHALAASALRGRRCLD